MISRLLRCGASLSTRLGFRERPGWGRAAGRAAGRATWSTAAAGAFGVALVTGALATGCADDAVTTCPGAEPLALGDPDGHAEPLGAGPGQARAGRITAAGQLPATTLGLETWAVGDFVLANDRVALVIEDVGESDLYDPWGGRPVGMARVEGGALVDPADFGEFFLLTGRSTVVTTSVTVINDGSDGQPAVVRAAGRLAPLPFLDPLVSQLIIDDLRDMEAAIDYVLAPDAEVVDVVMRYGSGRDQDAPAGTTLHGFMYTKRMPAEIPGAGFTDTIAGAPWIQLIDEDATSWAYRPADGRLGGGLSQSGFIGAINDPYTITACGQSERAFASIVIGGPGLDGLEQARARVEGRTLRAVSGRVTGIAPGGRARVHALDGDGKYLTRAPVDASGDYTLHVPADASVTLWAYQPGGQPATVEIGTATTADLTLPEPGRIVFAPVVDDQGAVIPARVQVLASSGGSLPDLVPPMFGEPMPPGGRAVVSFSDGTPLTVPMAAGTYRVVVSRGPEYELYEDVVDVVAGQDVDVAAILDHVVDTTGIQCGDFHIHTIRSNDSGDDELLKVQSGIGDGVEILVRSDHEYVGSFQPLIEAHGYDTWAVGVGSIEMTSFEVWGHMGVFPLDADPRVSNAGAPRWQTWPTAADPDAPVVTRGPIEVFDAVRARPEQPTIIINHPHSEKNYFGYVGLDPLTGTVARPEAWDDEFTLVEVFNDSGWVSNKNGTVADWFSILNTGRPVFAVGSSDSHGIRTSPVGYPRTCIPFGTDDPGQLDGDLVRDRLAPGHAFISGGIYLDVSVTAGATTAGPGDTVTTGALADVDITVQAASWVDVDTLEVVVDGQSVATIAITPGDADPGNPTVRWRDVVPVDVAAAGSWVVVASYGNATLEPVHPGRVPFAVSNPIFLTR